MKIISRKKAGKDFLRRPMPTLGSRATEERRKDSERPPAAPPGCSFDYKLPVDFMRSVERFHCRIADNLPQVFQFKFGFLKSFALSVKIFEHRPRRLIKRRSANRNVSVRGPPKSIPTTENGADCSTRRAGNGGVT
ncbi:hypothetical protein TNCV_1163141 [Trichonephila clavipes]|nr:hypothetical protein TNCV_1163141 [Trichonephila clavipes]